MFRFQSRGSDSHWRPLLSELPPRRQDWASTSSLATSGQRHGGLHGGSRQPCSLFAAHSSRDSRCFVGMRFTKRREILHQGPGRHGPASPDVGLRRVQCSRQLLAPRGAWNGADIWNTVFRTHQAGPTECSPRGWGLLEGQLTLVSGQWDVWEGVLAKTGLHFMNLRASGLHRGCTGKGRALTPFCLLSF